MIDNVTPDEAKKAMDSVAKMEGAGLRRATPGRWFGAGIAVLVASLFALYALQDPYPYIVFPIIGLAIFMVSAREKSGAYERSVPTSTTSKWAGLAFILVLLIVFFGSIAIRRVYDAAWVSLVAGLLVGVVIFVVSESARRAHLARVSQAEKQ